MNRIAWTIVAFNGAGIIVGFALGFPSGAIMALAAVCLGLAIFRLSQSYLLSESEEQNQLRLEEERLALKRQVASLEEDLANMKSQMEQLSRLSSLGEVAGTMGHEINNQLAVMEGWAEHLANIRKKPERCEVDFVEKAGVKIRSHIEKLNQLTSALRNFVRKNNKAEFSRLNMRDIIEDTVNIAQPKLKKHGVLLKSFFEGENLQLDCRGVEISQVLLNLISNAIDAIAEQESPWIQVRALAKGDHIEVSVTDSGLGIPSNLIQKIMEPYFTTKEPGKGTGIGLSISQDIIQSHGGRLEYDAHFKHTRFVIRLPIDHSVEEASSDENLQAIS